MARFIEIILHLVIIVFLTAISQLGGLAWLIALAFRRRALAFAASYALLSLAALWIAPLFGREPLPCGGDGALRMQSKLYCVLNRQYAAPELKAVLLDLAKAMERDHPGATTRILDAGFPFLDGFPLAPHLSHDDGRKADIAFFYRDETGYLPGATRSPIGYFAFEDGPTDCPDSVPTLRWNLSWLQGFWPDLLLDRPRMRSALLWLSADPRVGKVLLEPHLKARLDLGSPKIRFQGCRAARHDDHIHVQL